MQQIGVIGGTGMIGQPVVKELISAGFKVRCLVRDPAKAKSMFPAGVETIQADARDLQSLEVGLKGCEGLYLNLQVDKKSKGKGWDLEREGLNNILAAAKKVSVQHIVYLSSIIKDDPKDANWWCYQIKKQAVEAISQSNVPATILCPSCFMENLPNLQIQGNNLMHITGTNNPNYWISGSDFGKTVVSCFKNAKSQGKTYWVQGTEALTLDQSVDVFLKNYSKKKLAIRGAPLWLLKIFGLFNSEMGFGMRIMTSVTQMPEPFKAEPTWQDLHKPQVTLAEFAKNC